MLEVTASIAAVQKATQVDGSLFKCRFPFRYRLLREYGLVKPQRGVCDKLQFFKEELSFSGLSVSFVSQYAESPASIMGHIFLQFKNPRGKIHGTHNSNLDKTVNYAAAMPRDTNILAYVVGGITGWFSGQYSLYQYADMVKKYSDIESRDIFRYKLNFSEEEIERSIEHIWELILYGQQDYFFFDENCALQVLAILNAVRPDLQILDEVGFYTSPLSVIKIIDKLGLVKSIAFEPSLFHKLQSKLKAMDETEIDQFEHFSATGFLDTSASPLVAESMIDMLDINRYENRGQLAREQEKQYDEVLAYRSSLGIAAPYMQEITPNTPHAAHGGRRLASGRGLSQQSPYSFLSFRPGIHDLVSQPAGFQKNSAFQILTAQIRIYDESQRPILGEVILFDIKKLSSESALPSLVWSFDYRLASKENSCSLCLTPNFQHKAGFSQTLFKNTVDIFYLGSAQILPYVGQEQWQGGLGLTLGASLSIRNWFRITGFQSRHYNSKSQELDESKISAAASWTKNFDLRAGYTKANLDGNNIFSEISGGIGYSF